MVETRNGRTDSQAKGIPSHRLCPGWNTGAPRGDILAVFWQVPLRHSQIFPVGISVCRLPGDVLSPTSDLLV